ncbi:diversity-generating retroelement protein Avd [Myxococcota bacterium]|nr:diversity-generating retroelement protein Avd [Myxococcota bacterium]
MKDLRILVQWEQLTDDLMERTSKFPKAIRFTLARRIEDAALDAMEGLTRARYAQGRATAPILAEVDGSLARVRVLLRLAYRRRHLSHGAYEALSAQIDEVGRMLGGWRRGFEGGA